MGVCKDCNWSHGISHLHECRLRSPVAASDNSEAWWPIVRETDWCGDFRPKRKETETEGSS